MGKYKISVKGKGVVPNLVAGENPIDAFNKVYPNIKLTSVDTANNATVCIELVDGQRKTTNYYTAQTNEKYMELANHHFYDLINERLIVLVNANNIQSAKKMWQNCILIEEDYQIFKEKHKDSIIPLNIDLWNNIVEKFLRSRWDVISQVKYDYSPDEITAFVNDREDLDVIDYVEVEIFSNGEVHYYNYFMDGTATEDFINIDMT